LKINKWDSIFSKIIRTRDKWSCVRCGKKFTNPTSGLHNSHYFGRSKYSTRFDDDNCDALCYGCHQYWGSTDREGYRAFKIKQLGENRFNALQVRASQLVKRRDYQNDLVYKGFQMRLKELENKS
tara:strand:+ start:477 stop:851 length:375 start_codon:yes stop_codon:yes gene_type:complete